MDNCGTSEPFRFTLDTSSGASTPGSSPGSVDALIHQTRAELNKVVQEITSLCHCRLEASNFWNAYLGKLLSATAAEGAILWQRERDDWFPKFTSGMIDPKLLCDNRTATPSTGAHDRLIAEVADTSGPVVVPPGSSWSSEQPGNPTDFPAALIPLELDADQSTDTLLEVFLPSGGGPSTQRGYLRFLTQMANLAVGYLRRNRLQEAQRRETELLEISKFIESLHSIRNAPKFANELTNRLADYFRADRVSLLFFQPPPSRNVTKKPRVVAVSHCETVDQKSPVVVKIVEVASAGDLGSGVDYGVRPTRDDQAHASEAQAGETIPRDKVKPQPKANEFVPKSPSLQGAASLSTRCVIGVDQEGLWKLVIEDSNPCEFVESEQRQWEFLIPQLAMILETSVVLQSSTNQKHLRNVFSIVRGVGGRFALPVAALLVIGIAAWIPVPLMVTAAGHLEPEELQTIYAPRSAVIDRVLVTDGQRVEVGQPLIILSDPELSHSVQTALGRRLVLESRITELQQKLIDSQPNESEQVFRVQSELVSLREELQAIIDELGLLEQQKRGLTLVSQTAGIVDAWQLQESSYQRPVSRGQSLLRIFNDSGEWTVIAGIPENRLSHLGSDGKANKMAVKIVLGSAPQVPIDGTLTQLGSIIQDGDPTKPQGDFVAAKIRVTSDQLPVRQAGVPATVSISCGVAPIGYVIGEDLIRMVRTTAALYR